MDVDSGLTAYCGLYCSDCIPSNRALFAAVDGLRALASQLNLERYAELISESDEAFVDYPAFASVLESIAGLRCAAPCRQGGGRVSCAIRDCALERGFDGCWDCSERGACGLLAPLRRFHGETIAHNLDAIAERGTGSWAERRGKHYPWS